MQMMCLTIALRRELSVASFQLSVKEQSKGKYHERIQLFVFTQPLHQEVT
jgi:hypothetical protein